MLFFLSIIFFVLLSSAFIFLYKAINNNTQKAQQDMTVWQMESLRRDDIRSLDRSLQKISNERTLLETHFAKSSDVVPFLDTIERLAPMVGAVAHVNSVDTSTDSTGLTVGLKASGSFEAIYKFLKLLENSPYELEFLSMDIHKLTMPDVLGKPAADSQWEAVFKIQLLSFVQ